MRIKKIQIDSFGVFKNKTIDFNSNISIIKGLNESGKTTMEEVLLTSLFGFRNMNKSKRSKNFRFANKVIPYDEKSASLTTIFSDNSGEFSIYRYIQDNIPYSDIIRNSIRSRMDNNPLNILASMSWQTYKGIYSLDIDDMSKLNDKWNSHHSNLLAGLYPEYLNSYNNIITSLNKKIKSTWRIGTNSGEYKRINSEILVLKDKLVKSKQIQNEIRNLESQKYNTKDRLDNFSTTINELDISIEDYKNKLFIYKEIEKINVDISLSRTIKLYSELPNDINEFYASKENRINEYKRHIDTLKSKKDMLLNNIATHMKKLSILDSENAIRKSNDYAKELRNINSKIIDIKAKVNNNNSVVNKLIESFFYKDISKDCINIIINLDLPFLYEKLQEIDSLEKECLTLQAKGLARANPTTKGQDIIIYVLLLLILFLFLILPFPNLYKILGSIAPVFFTIIYTITKAKAKKKTISISSFYNQRELTLNNAKDEILQILNCLPIPKQNLNNLDINIINKLSSIQDLLVKSNTHRNELEELQIHEYDYEIYISDTATFVLNNSSNCEIDIENLNRALAEARLVEKEVSSLKMLVKNLDEQIQNSNENIMNEKFEINEMNQAILTLEGQNRNEKIDNLSILRNRHNSAIHRLNNLEKDYPEMKNTIAEYNSHQQIIDIQVALNQAIDKRKQMDNTYLNDTSESGSIDAKISQMMENSPTPISIQSQILDLESEKAERIFKRDSYVLALGIIKRALENFNNNNSPKFLKTASEYLSFITDSKYREIQLNEDGTSIIVSDDNNRTFNFDEIDSYLSRGTREQIYLSLRLAMYDKFDPDNEKLPIIFDEALINWDKARFSNFLKLISDISKQRQVIIFTCHDYVLDIAKSVNLEFSEILI